MSSHHNSPGDYTRRHSFQPPPVSPPRSIEIPARPGSTNVNQELAHSYPGYHPQASINGSANYYSTEASNPGPYGTAHHYQQEHDPAYYPNMQGTVPAPYASGQGMRNVYSPPGVDTQWTPGHQLGGGFQRSTSWSPPHHADYSPPQIFSHGSSSMTQVYMPNNNRRRREVMVPQRQYVPHHRQNYFDHFAPESDITFPSRTGPDGIPLADVLNDNFDNLVGRDDPMFAGYVGPAISLRLEWPGYKSWTKQIKTRDWRRDPKPITKAKLAIEVAKKVQNFIQENANEPISSGSEGWRVGPGALEAKDLILVRLVHVSKGSWQAEFRATTR